MHQNNWLHNVSYYFKHILIASLALACLITVGSLAGHQINASTVYSYDNNQQVGSNDLINNRHKLYLPHASAAVAMDAQTGQIVYQKNDNQRRLIASTGKLMTLYLAGRKINNTPGAWNQNVAVNNGLRRMSYDGNDGGYHFINGHHYNVGNLMKAGIIASSNNAAIALGQWVGYTNHHFLYMENKQDRLWHLHDHFISASGLENGDLKPWGYGVKGYGNAAGNEISAKDLAVIAYHIIKDEPWFLKYSKINDMHEDGQNLYNYNEFLPDRDYPYLVKGLHVDGLKTGWTPRAGYCFVGTAQMPGHHRIITVVLHDDHQWHDSAKLMRYAYKYSKLLRN
ncbi:D-alanyl-D-alanine carboxypeptidase family protein [Acetilactobacillus jinshanensis]|uniref:D-alanyl-D-alanine carboxypeptidase n=1 Tax=Acetilactobacillus jinshanensis TaxID=1720083 RepID=A0A4P6ZL28_9LACO|nr:serine hydrolase [Acetilactobacillus jinshanensis]QBP18358.1 D-alanyl-D-alanine carboxypeptidase [Acetilactobacillus jinshanensis]